MKVNRPKYVEDNGGKRQINRSYFSWKFSWVQIPFKHLSSVSFVVCADQVIIVLHAGRVDWEETISRRKIL
jgi:hypothetical protein